MAVSKTSDPNIKTGKRELTPTEKRTLVSERDVMAILLDVLGQASRCGMRTAITTRDHNGRKVVLIAFADNAFDVVAEGGTFKIDGRAITEPSDWDDLRDVMAEVEGA